jgi:hypothetical protein
LQKRKPVELKLPSKLDTPTSWIVAGFDLSLSRSGWAVTYVQSTEKGTVSEFIGAGSVKPKDTSDPVWVRGRLIGRGLIETVFTPKVTSLLTNGAGLIICFEAFTPRNDYLSSVRRLVDSVFFSSDSPLLSYPLHVLSINASTLRSIMGLVQRGAKNKKENIVKSFEFIDSSKYPEIDSDACDGVLLATVGRYVVSLLSGFPDEVPNKALVSLCDAKQEVKGKGRNSRIVTKGVLHHPEYWAEVKPQTSYTICMKDASNPKKALQTINISI